VNHWAKRISGFALIPALAMISPLIALPFITRAAGAEGWAAIATGQALGATASLIIQFGWGTTGPPLVATKDERAGRSLYFTSVLMRATIFIVASPIAIVIACMIVPGEWTLIVALMCAASAVSGLSPGWYFVGIGRPLPLMWFETLPRLGGVFLSTLLIAITGNLLLYALTTVVVETTMVVISASKLSRPTLTFRAHIGEVSLHIREQWSLAASALVSSGYTRLSVPLVAIIAYSQAPVFASTDRIQTLSRSVIKPFVQSFQGWVAESLDDEIRFKRKFLISTGVVSALTFALSSGVAILLPIVDTLLFGPEITITSLQSALLGLAVFAIGISNCTSTFFLAPQRRISTIATSTIAGSIVGVPMIWLGATFAGATGALAAIAVVELFVVGWQIVKTLATIRSWPRA
jgi:O-antigen/teichoic acid export membrane protein